MKEMSSIIKNYYSHFKRYLNDNGLITDILAKLIITFGVVLIIAGIYLMIVNPNVSSQANVGTQTPVATVAWVPGIPFFAGDLANVNAIVVGSVSWILGVDLLLVGMGLWVRHRFARLAAIMTFSLAAFFQFIQFLLFGILGSPTSLVELGVNALLVFLLLTKFDAQKTQPTIGTAIKLETTPA